MADIREILQSKRTCAVLCGQGKYCDNCTDAAAELEQLIKEKQLEAGEKKRKEINRMILSAEPYDKGEGWVALKFSEGLYRNIAGEIAFNDRIAELEGEE